MWNITISLCVCVGEHISGTTGAIFTKFLCMCPMALTRSSSGSVAIRCVLPVLWIMSRLAVMGHIAYFNTRVESDVDECLVLRETSHVHFKFTSVVYHLTHYYFKPIQIFNCLVFVTNALKLSIQLQNIVIPANI